MRRLAKAVVLAATALAVAGSSVPAAALVIDEGYSNRSNDVLYYNSKAAACTTSGSAAASPTTDGAPDGAATDGLTAEQAAFVDKYQAIAQRLSVEYGIPWEAVMAQGILESGAGSSEYARERNNFFGIGAFDSNPDNAFRYATPDEGWEGYFKNITKTPTYRNHGVFQGDTVTDPYAYTKAIKAAGYATDPEYVAKVSKFVRAVELRSQEKSWTSSADLAKQHPEMAANAAKYAQGGAAPADSGSTGAGGSAGGQSCGGSSSIPGPECADALPRFRAAMASGKLTIQENVEADLEHCYDGAVPYCTPGAQAKTLRGLVAAAENSGLNTMKLWNINEGHGCDGMDHPNGLASDIAECNNKPAKSDEEECKKLFDYLIANKDQLDNRYLIWNGSYCNEKDATVTYVSCNGDHSDHIHVSFNK